MWVVEGWGVANLGCLGVWWWSYVAKYESVEVIKMKLVMGSGVIIRRNDAVVRGVGAQKSIFGNVMKR